MTQWLSDNVVAITVWSGALCTFAIYSVLYAENRFYRLFEHIFIGLGAGYGVYMTWSQVLGPRWWDRMVNDGKWQWAFAAVVGSMFYFIYSKKHLWISRIVFGLLMGLAAGGMFREFYEIYFPQMGASMKPIAGKGMTALDTVNAIIIYVILLTCMSYFFFSFEHRNKVLRGSAAMGRWFLMIGFGAIFGATVMGRMTLFIGRFNFLLNEWVPQVGRSWQSPVARSILIIAAVALLVMIYKSVFRRGSNPTNPEVPDRKSSGTS